MALAYPTLSMERVIEAAKLAAHRVGGVVQSTQIKVESFTFTKYGLWHGEVLRVSTDAIQDEKQGLLYSAGIP